MGHSNVTVQNIFPVEETGNVELIGINSAAVPITLAYSDSNTLPISGGPISGKIKSLMLSSGLAGTGAVQGGTGQVIFFDADPAITAGDTAMTVAESKTVIGVVQVVAADWVGDAVAKVAYIDGRQVAANLRASGGLDIPFHSLSNIYVAFLNTDGTATWNSAAGDDENLDINVWYQRET